MEKEGIEPQPGTNGEDPTKLHNFKLMPSELFLKFRKEIEGVGFNLEVSYFVSTLLIFLFAHLLCFCFCGFC